METTDLADILFLDIECVSGQAEFDELDDDFQELWHHKCRSLLRRPDGAEPSGEEVAEQYRLRAGIYAEFGRIVCISVGLIVRDAEQQLGIRLKSFQHLDERQLLLDFSALISRHYNNPARHHFCGHNIKEFDIPYICRRMVIHQLELPVPFRLYGKKPWETRHLLDTMELWKFGDGKHFTSLKLLAAVLGFPSPKDDIDGSEVGRVFWEDQDLDRIALYCEKDVLATAQLYLRLRRLPLLPPEQVVHVGR
ncbi:MAG: hypothetical protein RLY31_1092 [Bacteroidota bacterium]|jgi:hypothetical protein